MPMAIPKASPAAVKLFEELGPADPGVTAKKMFGQPAAFVNGNLFFGVYGEDLFVRLSESDRGEAAKVPGFRTFEPMPGRAMREYMVLPTAILEHPDHARRWVTRSLRFAASLPPKRAKPKRR